MVMVSGSPVFEGARPDQVSSGHLARTPFALAIARGVL